MQHLLLLSHAASWRLWEHASHTALPVVAVDTVAVACRCVCICISASGSGLHATVVLHDVERSVQRFSAACCVWCCSVQLKSL
jgi:hypothetical protein